MGNVVVLGAGIVGRAAAWDMVRRGHETTILDINRFAAREVAEEVGCEHGATDVAEPSSLYPALTNADVVVSAVPYRFGLGVASEAVAAGCHYVDFGGNPSVVRRQLALHEGAIAAQVAIVPDCGLAPGLANVLAVADVLALGDGPVDRVTIRVGALPARPEGTLGYQLAFNPAGLINEYAEPCDVLRAGRHTTVEPLTDVEEVTWPGWGPLEAFHTAGGASSLPMRWEHLVDELDYKTLRFPGHVASIRAIRELGLFDEEQRMVAGTSVAPRDVLLEALDRTLPRGADDVVLIRTTAEATRHDGRFSALARTTAFPTTALAHLMAGGHVAPGARTMDGAIDGRTLMGEIEAVGITVGA